MGQPTTSTSPFGATTTTSYYPTASPPYTLTSVNGRWTKTTLDGLGRTIKLEAGNGSTTVSATDTVYDSCGCSPTGKMTQTSVPHGPSDTVVWTTYTYDGIGRTLSVLAPDGNSTTTYSYQGNTVTVTDAANKWKKYTTDVLGQVVQMNEPNPAGGSDYVTTYTYDWFGHLTQVSMTRPTGTQTRTFNYGSPAGPLLLSTTNPENGTVSTTYNSDNTLATVTDAKSQQTQYTYDSLKRVTQIRRGVVSGSTFTEDTCQQENYTYGTSGNELGQLTSLQYQGGYSPAMGTCDTTFTESYTHSQAGAIAAKSLGVVRPNLNSMLLMSSYTYDNEGRMTAVQYPSSWNGSSWVTGPNLGNTFDSMGRLQKLTDLTASSDIISAATYGAAGQMLTMTGNNGAPSESRTYNSMLQLTDLVSGSLHYQYAFSATQNNGKITSETDVVSGEQITYTYDSLNRLASATSSVNPGWGQSYNYDGFGNLTTQTVTKGTAPALSVSYDATTNRRSGECADANGIINSSTSCTNGEVYDIQNRLIRNGGSSLAWAYSYAPGNKRIWRGGWSGSTQTTDEITFWSITGQKLISYNVSVVSGGLVAMSSATYQYFGGKLIKNAGGYVTPDRLGSIGKYFPYGQERPSATTDGTEKFATYFRDSETGLDYAQNRYHEPGAGRFRTPDPGQSGSNWYAYAGGDPVNNSDPSGLDFLSALLNWLGTGWAAGFDPGFGGCEASFYCDGQWEDSGGPMAGNCLYQGQAPTCVPWSVYSAGAGCFAGSGFVSAEGAPGCGDDTTEPAPPLPSCTLTSYARGLGGSGPLGPGFHGYLVFGSTATPGVSLFIEGWTPDLKTLQAWVNQGSGISGDNPRIDSQLGSISGASVCGYLPGIESAVNEINASNVPYSLLGPNSSSALRYIVSQSMPRSVWANDAGGPLGGPIGPSLNLPSQGMLAFGWNTLLPGLETPKTPPLRRLPILRPRR
jgi:RHS repeat-associated protein